MAYGQDIKLQAKALWVTGAGSDQQIADRLGITRAETIGDWRRSGGWDAEKEHILRLVEERISVAVAETVSEMIRSINKKGGLVAAICASPAYVLAPSGVLDGKKATCYPGCQDKFGSKTTFLEDRVVKDGNIITSRGPGTALDFALEIVETLKGEVTAGDLEHCMLVS